jgi:hypothetical protein
MQIANLLLNPQAFFASAQMLLYLLCPDQVDLAIDIGVQEFLDALMIAIH